MSWQHPETCWQSTSGHSYSRIETKSDWTFAIWGSEHELLWEHGMYTVGLYIYVSPFFRMDFLAIDVRFFLFTLNAFVFFFLTLLNLDTEWILIFMTLTFTDKLGTQKKSLIMTESHCCKYKNFVQMNHHICILFKFKLCMLHSVFPIHKYTVHQAIYFFSCFNGVIYIMS